MKTSACRDGTLKNQPNKMGTTPQHIYTIPTACPNVHMKNLDWYTMSYIGNTQNAIHFLELIKASHTQDVIHPRGNPL